LTKGFIMTLNSKEHMQEIKHFFDSCWYDFNEALAETLIELAEAGHITFNIPGADETGETWEGEIYIDVSKLSIETLVNDIIADASADEISIEDGHILRLWWD
jgi:hypothetical protein